MAGHYLYLVQPKKYINTNVYKIGRTHELCDSRKLSRFNAYGPTTIVYNTYRIGDSNSNSDNYIKMESELKNRFNDNFELVEGCEYFKGDINIMQQMFNNICANVKTITDNVKTDLSTIINLEPPPLLTKISLVEHLINFLEIDGIPNHYKFSLEEIQHRFIEYIKSLCKEEQNITFRAFIVLLTKINTTKYYKKINSNGHHQSAKYIVHDKEECLDLNKKNDLAEFMESYNLYPYSITISRIIYDFNIYYSNKYGKPEIIRINVSSFGKELKKYSKKYHITQSGFYMRNKTLNLHTLL